MANGANQPTPTISTHVLDTEHGTPAVGVHVTLYRLSDDGRPLRLTQALTDSDGRVRDLLERPLVAGDYRLEFNLAGDRGEPPDRRHREGPLLPARLDRSAGRRPGSELPRAAAAGALRDHDLPGKLTLGRDTLAVTSVGQGSRHGSRHPPAAHRRPCRDRCPARDAGSPGGRTDRRGTVGHSRPIAGVVPARASRR